MSQFNTPEFHTEVEKARAWYAAKPEFVRRQAETDEFAAEFGLGGVDHAYAAAHEQVTRRTLRMQRRTWEEVRADFQYHLALTKFVAATQAAT
jgi:hypothetical protein